MSLIDHWQHNKAEFEAKKLHQVLSYAGDGCLKDGNITSQEFRSLLKLLSPEVLKAYSDHCVDVGFKDSGLALQDIVNEVGHRLDFQVNGGKYRGSASEPGHDGLWKLPDGKSLIIEVKTSTDFNFDLDRIAEYKKHLAATNQVDSEATSILIVIGRPTKSTKAVEAQIRGGRHAWEMRLIGVEALFRLLEIRLSIEDTQTLKKIHDLLFPMEFTSLDGIIDLVFTTKEEVTQMEAESLQEGGLVEESASTSGTKSTPVSFQAGMLPTLEAKLGVTLVKQSRVAYEDPRSGRRFLLLSSRPHAKSYGHYFWFALHAHQRAYLGQHPESAIALACGSPDDVLLVPHAAIEPLIPILSHTSSDDRNYWHLVIVNAAPGDWKLVPLSGNPSVDLSPFKV